MKKNVAQIIFSSALSRYSGMVLTFASMVVLSNFKGVDFLGRFSFYLGIASSCFHIAYLGISEALSAQSVLGKNNCSNALLKKNISSLFALYAGYVAVGCIAIIFGYDVFGNTLMWVAAWGGINSVAWTWQLKKNTSSAISALIMYLIPAVALFLATVVITLQGVDDIGSALSVMAIVSNGFFFLISIFLIASCKGGIKDKNAPQASFSKGTVYIGINLALARSIQSVFLWIPIWSAVLIGQDAWAGLLSIVMRVGVAFSGVSAAARVSFRKTLLDLYKRKYLSRLSFFNSVIGTYIATINIIASIAAIFIGDQLLGIVFGEGMEGGGVLLAIILLAFAVEVYSGFVEDVMRVAYSVNYMLAIQVACIIGLAASIFLVKEYLMCIHVFVVAFLVFYSIYYSAILLSAKKLLKVNSYFFVSRRGYVFVKKINVS